LQRAKKKVAESLIWKISQLFRNEALENGDIGRYTWKYRLLHVANVALFWIQEEELFSTTLVRAGAGKPFLCQPCSVPCTGLV
jgi:hypothetical protein